MFIPRVRRRSLPSLNTGDQALYRVASTAGACHPSHVVQVNLTRHLFSFFPQLQGQQIDVAASDVAGVMRALEARAPGIGFYLCDEHGRLRPHVNVFIGNDIIRDRRQLSDAVRDGDRVSILQALSGG